MINRGFLFFLLFTAFASIASASEWVVERATKNVSVSVDGSSWRTVRAGDAIPNANWVRTGPRDRVLLSKGSERVMYRESTLAAISVSQPIGEKTKITQKRGSILLAVKKRRTQHTSVVTPHLAAVVKGTVFEVVVGSEQSKVRVDRGLVEVSDGDRSVEVPGGRIARAGINEPGISVSDATETSLDAAGMVGLELAEIKSNGNGNGNGSNGNGNNGNGSNGNGSNGNGSNGNGSNGNGNGNNGNGNGNGS